MIHLFHIWWISYNEIFNLNEFQIEPLEMAVDDLQKESLLDKDSTERLDTGQVDGNQG